MNNAGTVRINLFMKIKLERQIPKLIKYVFLCYLFAFGFDFGFINIINKTRRSFAKFISVISVIVTLSVCAVPVIFSQNTPQIEHLFLVFVFAQQTIHVLCLRFSTYNLYHFIKDTYKLDENIMINKENKVCAIFIAYFTVIYVAKIIGCTSYCTNGNCYMGYIPNGVHCAITFGTDVICLVQLLIYYYIYDAVKCLMHNMDKAFDSKLIRKQYTDIANCSDNIHWLYGKMVSKTYSIICKLMWQFKRLLS